MMGPCYTVNGVLMALNEGLLTKGEAKAALADLIPALREINNARATVAAAEEN